MGKALGSPEKQCIPARRHYTLAPRRSPQAPHARHHCSPRSPSWAFPRPSYARSRAIGYESASPIQAATIPALLEGADVLGQAQTGTGKTAAFALPILSRLDLKGACRRRWCWCPRGSSPSRWPRPSRSMLHGQHGFHVLPIYGGQSYVPQLNALKRGPQVIVGTPGRIMDHLERGTLQLDGIRTAGAGRSRRDAGHGLSPTRWRRSSRRRRKEKQVALFSATMAPNIRRIAQRHLRDPRESRDPRQDRHGREHQAVATGWSAACTSSTR
jgi:ATP-dependent RNA helicase DeaD